MGTYEVASALQPYADRLIASSEMEPGTGWQLQRARGARRRPEHQLFGVAIVDSFIAHTLRTTPWRRHPRPRPDGWRSTRRWRRSRRRWSSGRGTVAPRFGRTLAGNPRRPEPKSDVGPPLTRPGNADGHDQRRSAADVVGQVDAVLAALNDGGARPLVRPAHLLFSGLSIYFPPATYGFEQAYVYAAPNPAGGSTSSKSGYRAGQGIAEN